jgi:hypothetical protein
MQERLLQTAVLILGVLAVIIVPYLIGRLIHPIIRKYVTVAGPEDPGLLIWMMGFITIGGIAIGWAWFHWVLYGTI